MKLFMPIFAIASIALISCHNKALKDELICTELFSDSAVAEQGIPKAAAENNALWPHSRDVQLHLSVKFMNGSDFQRKKVMQYAAIWDSVSLLGWNGKHKINFMFVPDTYPPQAYTDVRILFRPGGSSSYIGMDCQNIPRDQPTTFFGWIDQNHSEAEIRQVVLHELGHVLGLIHEHQSPAAHIPWNKEDVYKYYHDTQNPPWTREMVDNNIFRLYDASTTNYTKFDSLSIMCYAIPPSITYGGYSTPWNSNLSTIDSAFIRKIYPYYPCIVGETCCYDRKGHRIPCP
jgi:serralysin